MSRSMTTLWAKNLRIGEISSADSSEQYYLIYIDFRTTYYKELQKYIQLLNLEKLSLQAFIKK